MPTARGWLAGADVSPPTALERTRERLRPRPTPAVRESRFAQLLTPMPKAELRLLQQELQQDTPLFVVFERSRRLGATRHQIGFAVGLVATVWFFAPVGSNYATALANAAKYDHPTWLHLTAANHSLFNGLWLGFGLLLPLAAGLILAEAINYLWRGLSDWRPDDILQRLLALICAGVIYHALLSDAYAIVALGFAVAWLLARAIVRTFLHLTQGMISNGSPSY